VFYRAADVAEVLRCSEWWVKAQARQRRIPYCWIGGSYRFTEEHLVEIARRFEVRPADPAERVPAPRRSPSRPADVAGAAVVQLTARLPRRARAAASQVAA
jgi:hypothetical protein